MKENNTSTREPGWYTVRTSKGWMRAFYSNGWNIDLPVLEVKENNVPGLGNPDDAQLRRTACTPESQIERGNRLIAGIMDFVRKQKRNKEYYWIQEPMGDMGVWDCELVPEFHGSWNMLMPVVEKIERIKGVHCVISELGCDIYHFGKEVSKAREESKILTVWASVVNFIEWLNQGEDEAQRQRIVETEAQPETPAPTTQDTNKCCLCNSFPCKCFGRIGEPPTTQLNQKEFDLLVNGRFDNPVSDDAPLLPPTTQQDKPVLSGEVEGWVPVTKELPPFDTRVLFRGFISWKRTDRAVRYFDDELTMNTETLEYGQQAYLLKDESDYVVSQHKDIGDISDQYITHWRPISFSLPAPVVQDVEHFVGNVELFKGLWYKRNPVHDLNADTGEDMFWGTAELVAKEYVTHLQSLSKQSTPQDAGDFDTDASWDVFRKRMQDKGLWVKDDQPEQSAPLQDVEELKKLGRTDAYKHTKDNADEWLYNKMEGAWVRGYLFLAKSLQNP